MSEKFKHFMRFGHIPLLILLQVIFIILFATFVVYDPKSVQPHGSTKTYNLTKYKENVVKDKEKLKDDKFEKKYPNHADIDAILHETDETVRNKKFAEYFQTTAEGAYSGYPCKYTCKQFMSLI